MGVRITHGTPQSEEAAPNVVPCTPSKVPSIVIAPPLGIDNQVEYFGGADCKQRSFLARVFDGLNGAMPGADLTSISVPAVFNLPKSQVQCFSEQVYCCGQNLLEQCNEGATPLDRLLAVVRWHISLVRPAPFLKAPYNPILGETHHVTAGDLSVIAEQVSHHPPLTAVYATNTKKKIEFFQLCKPIPRFCGNSVEVTIFGRQTLCLTEHGETYEMTPPKLVFRLLPYSTSEWAGETVVRCAATGLEAAVSFKSRSLLGGATKKVCGSIKSTTSGKVLYTLCGNWDKTVMLEDKETGIKTVLFDGKAALSNLKTPSIKDRKAVSPMDSVLVWSKLTEALWNRNWEAAREAKSNVEEHQRALRTKRLEAGETWEPKYFTQTADKEWEWASPGQPVPEGPIVC